MKKTTAKTTVKLGALIPQAHGGAIRNGGTNRGGPGRPPQAYKDFLRGCLGDEKGRQEFLSVIRDSRHPAYSAAISKAMLYVLGAPSRPNADDNEEPAQHPRVHRLMDLLIAQDPVDGPQIIEIPEGYTVKEQW